MFLMATSDGVVVFPVASFVFLGVMLVRLDAERRADCSSRVGESLKKASLNLLVSFLCIW
jgi:hypothetical protein